MSAQPHPAAWTEVIARAAALAIWVCAAHACTGPGLEPPREGSSAGAGAAQDAGGEPTGGSAGISGGAGASGTGGFTPPSGGTGGQDSSDAGEAEMDASVDDDDGGLDPTND